MARALTHGGGGAGGGVERGRGVWWGRGVAKPTACGSFAHCVVVMSSHEVRMTRAERRLGRFELMSWINSFLRTEYTKVEEFSDGIAYCQVLDAMIPDCVPLHKLVFHPRNKQDKMRNLKILKTIT